VIIPTRNRPELLRRAVTSVVAQTYRPIQLVIIDNMSDSPVEVDPRDLHCIVHRNTAILNPSANRNLGVRLSAGSLLCFLDDDDTYLPEKLNVLADALDGVDLCYGNTRMVGMNGAALGVSRSAGAIEDLMLHRNVHTNSTLMRRRLFDDVSYDESMMTFEDIDFIFRVVRNHPVRHVDRVVAIWNRDDRPDQVTSRNLPRSCSSWQVLCERFSNEIDGYPRVARFYYGKMVLLALTQGKFVTAWRFLARYALRGLRSSRAS
jgi:glycosyltransferase involved in cell wall biosynthesis